MIDSKSDLEGTHGNLRNGSSFVNHSIQVKKDSSYLKKQDLKQFKRIKVCKEVSIPEIPSNLGNSEYQLDSHHHLNEKVLSNINYNKILIVDDEKFNCDIIYGFMMVLGIKNR